MQNNWPAELIWTLAVTVVIEVEGAQNFQAQAYYVKFQVEAGALEPEPGLVPPIGTAWFV